MKADVLMWFAATYIWFRYGLCFVWDFVLFDIKVNIPNLNVSCFECSLVCGGYSSELTTLLVPSPLSPPKKGTKPHPAEKFEDTQIFVFLASSSHVAALYLGALFHLAVNHVLGKVSTGR